MSKLFFKQYLNLFFGICLIFLSSKLIAQADSSQRALGDTMTLQQVLAVVMQNHPSIKDAQESVTKAEAGIGIAKSGWLPNADASASYSRIGPVPTIDFPPMGTFQLYPKDNYSAAVDVHQTIYDFGKTSRAVDLSTESKNIANQGLELTKQNLSLATINAFYSLAFLQDAVSIKDDQLKTLKEHLSYLQKKQETGSATQYELLSTKVRVTNTENEKVDLEAQMKIQTSVLNSLMGQDASNSLKVKKELSIAVPAFTNDSMLNFAYSHRMELSMAKEKETLAGLQYQLTKSQNNPVISAFASGGWKDGYVPELNKFTANFAVGVGVKVPLFDGNRLKYNMVQAKSGINSSSFQTEITRRNVTNQVIEYESLQSASEEKIKQFELQLQQAQQAFELAKVSYSSGAITNLDLLDAETALAGSKLLLLKARIDNILSVYRLKAAIGEQLY